MSRRKRKNRSHKIRKMSKAEDNIIVSLKKIEQEKLWIVERKIPEELRDHKKRSINHNINNDDMMDREGYVKYLKAQKLK